MAYTVTDLLRLPQGPVTLADLDPAATPGFSGASARPRRRCATWARSWPSSRSGCTPRPTPVGVAACSSSCRAWTPPARAAWSSKALGLLDPNGWRLKSFKKPTEEELAQDFLWRIDKALPEPGAVGVFDRSHYEDVLVAPGARARRRRRRSSVATARSTTGRSRWSTTAPW